MTSRRHGLVDQVEAAAGIVAVGKLRADIAHHIEEGAGIECEVRGGWCEVFAEGAGYLHTFFDLGLTDGAVVGATVIEVIVALDDMVLPTQPSIEALLLAVGLPHGEEGGEFVDGGLAADDVEHFVESLARDAHGFDLFKIYSLLTHPSASRTRRYSRCRCRPRRR